MDAPPVMISDRSLGTVWLSISRSPSTTSVNVAISVEHSWDVDIVIDSRQAVGLAEAMISSELMVVTGETSGRAAAALLAQNGRLGLVVLDDRISDLLTLGREVQAVADRLRAAAAEPPS